MVRNEEPGIGLVVLLFIAMLGLLELRCAPTEPAVVPRPAAAERRPLKPESCECETIESGIDISALEPQLVVDCQLSACVFACTQVRALFACEAVGRPCVEGWCLPFEE